MLMTLYRQDFKRPMDGVSKDENYFDDYLTELGLKDTVSITEVTIKVDRVIETERE